MHGLFTRVFLSFWISIVLIAAAAAALTAVLFVADRNNPARLTAEAQAVLDTEGLPGLRSWLTTRSIAAGDAGWLAPRALVIDERGHEIAGQRLHPPGPPPPAERPAAGTARPPPPMPGGPPPGLRPPGSELLGPDGAKYRIIFDPPPRQGPFAPPFAPVVRIAVLVLAIAISGLVSFLIARSIARPLESLQATARALSEGELSARPEPAVAARRDEIGLLAREFGAMAERVSAMIEARTRLLRDISHELRSPLARLQLAVGLARQGSTGREEPLARIEREGERLSTLIAKVLEYARFDRDPSSLTLENVDLGALLEHIVHDAQFEGRDTQARVTLTIDGAPLACRADPAVLHAAFDNVIRNALLHGGGQVTVRVARERDTLRVRVLDQGPGVPDDELARIFEPFYRVPGARAQGSGIGLAVAQRAVVLHGGQIAATTRPAGGLEIDIRLPAV